MVKKVSVRKKMVSKGNSRKIKPLQKSSSRVKREASISTVPGMSSKALPKIPTSECPVCGSRNVHYNKERAELVCRECGEIHAQIV